MKFRNTYGKADDQLEKVKALTLAATMGALANILILPIAVGSFESSIHFSQVPIFIVGVLAGPIYGLITGGIGGLFMGVYLPGIPFIIIGLAILGLANGLFARRLRPFVAGILAWCVQAPYVVITDFIWFHFFIDVKAEAIAAILTPIMIKLTVEAVISAFLADVLIYYIKKAGLTLQ